jgi:carbamoyltransferase
MSRYVLGISAHYHDAAAALLQDGELVAAASEERFSRIKHDPSLPLRAVQFCLKQAGISSDALENVVYYEKPLRKFERILVSQLQAFPKSLGAFQRGMRSWLADRIWLGATLPTALQIAPEKLLWSDHHLSHAASVFYGSKLPEAAILVVDGVGEWATTTLFDADEKGIRKLSEIRFPHSIGLVYSAFTAWLGFTVNDGEYKVMGMAAFGEPRFEEEVRKVIFSTSDGAFATNLDYVSYHYSAEDSFTKAFEKLLGPPRFPGSPFDPTTPEGKRYADVAASIQKVTEDLLVELACTLHKQTGREHLCMAGGVALNSVANRQILKRSPFKTLQVHPAAGDAGGAVGAALWAWNEVLGGKRGSGVQRPDLGEESSPDQLKKTLSELGVPFQEVDSASRAAEDIAEGKVIGWVQGRFEWGPRALGYRSILADPTRKEMLERVNTRVKFREPFRPFAPSVQAGAEDTYFELPEGGQQLSHWMLVVAPVKPAASGWATTHVDGSARAHRVEESTNPLYHRLLGEVGKHTGHPVVLNTSFNLKGEPMVSGPVEALASFRMSGLDALYLGPFRVAAGITEE